MKKRVVIAGGTGFVGQSLTRFLMARDYDIVVLTRASSHDDGGVAYEHWDGRTLGGWAQNLEHANALVNLTGRSINCRHTRKNRREIVESRVDSVRVLGQAIACCDQPPKVFVQAAGVGIYGDQGDRWCDEESAQGDDFPSQVCQRWEAAFTEISSPRTRKVLLRLGVVLGRDGAFLKVLSRLTRAFFGGYVGDGRQFVSWIHHADLARMFLKSIENEELTGVFNATAPDPVSNAELMRELRRALHRPWSPPVPKLAARIGSWLIGTQADLAFVSQRCAPKNFLDRGFHFEFPELRPALAQIYRNT